MEENKKVSDLPQINALAEGTMFVVEQNGSAYHATTKQIGSAVNKRPTKIAFSGDVCNITLEGDVSETLTFNRDSSGIITSVTDSHGHTCTLEGLE